MEETQDGRARVYATFAIVVLGCAAGGLSQTAVNNMLNDIMPGFGLSVATGQWFTTSYMLVLGITVPAVTFLSRRLSVRRHVLLALVVCLAGSLLCATAGNFWAMLAGRVLQAVSAGMLMPLMQTIAMTGFPPGRQASAMGVAGVALGFAPNIGPTVGGAMASTWGWRSFFVALALAAAALAIATLAAVPPRQAQDPKARLDAASLALSTVGFGGVLLGFSNASSYSPASPFVWAPVVVGALVLVWFVRRQRRSEHPLIDLGIFQDRRYRLGFAAQDLLYAAFMGVTLVIPLYIEDLCGGTTMQAGMVLLPGTIAALVLNPVAGALTDRVGIRPIAVVGGAFLVLGASLMVFLDQDTPLAVVMACQGIRQVGVSTLIAPLTSWTLEGLPHKLMTDGSSFSIVARQACASFGTSAMVFLITFVGASAADPALAYHAAFAFSAACSIALYALCLAKVR